MHLSHVEDYLNHISRQMPYPVFWTDADSKVLGTNAAGLQMMGAIRFGDVLGKYPHEFMPADLAERVVDQIKLVRASVQMQKQDETVCDPDTGVQRKYTVFRYPLTDVADNVIGIFGTAIDVSAEHDTLTLKQEVERSMLATLSWVEQVNAGIKEMAKAVAGLKALIPALHGVSRSQRTRFEQAVNALQDIGRQLRLVNQARATTLRADEFNDDQPEPVLLSALVNLVCKEKQSEFAQVPVSIQCAIADMAQFGFVAVQYRRCKRAIEQLVTNAVNALPGKKNATVIIKLDGSAETMMLAIQDNGQGMNFEMLDRMLNRKASGAEHARDNGMQLVWDMLEQNKGVMSVDTLFDQGTSIQLIFPRVATTDWMATQIEFTPDSMIVVLDADPAMHENWRRRFDIYLQLYPALRLCHFTQPDEALERLRSLDGDELGRVHWLCDVDFPAFGLSGPDLAATCKAGAMTLFTDRFHEKPLRQRAATLGIRMAPRELAGIIPLHCHTDETGLGNSGDHETG